MSHGREAARDLIYGRQGGRWAPPPTSTPGAPVPYIPVANLTSHMEEHHQDVIDAARRCAATATEIAAWHAADHERCGADRRHTHQEPPT